MRKIKEDRYRGKDKELRELWAPIRSGDIYCSPGCGGKCTWASYTLASKEAETLAKRLGRGWKPVVHERAAPGWNNKAESACGQIGVYWIKGRSFQVYEAHFNGFSYADKKSPRKAVEKVLKKAIAERNRITEKLDKYRKCRWY